jgi:ABC-type lipoprotein export system ATPase subunit
VGQRVILIGENGIGKSTLLKTIEGRVKPIKGKIILDPMAKLGYFDQELKDLKNSGTLYDEIYALLKNHGRTRQQLSLGGFFDDDEVYKPISQLSMGEKSRLNMIKVFIEKPNLLLLDEPTNHLDLDACEIMEKAFNRDYDYKPKMNEMENMNEDFLNELDFISEEEETTLEEMRGLGSSVKNTGDRNVKQRDDHAHAPLTNLNESINKNITKLFEGSVTKKQLRDFIIEQAKEAAKKIK